MLLLFIRTIWSTYVPISKTANPAISFISKSDIDSLGEIYKNLFVFAIKSSEKNKDYLISLITKMQILFEGSAKFALFDSNYIEKLEDKEKLKKNTMFYFANGYKFGAYSFSIYETETLFLIDSIVNENTKKEEKPIDNLDDLYLELGATYFTMLVTNVTYSKAVLLRKEAGMKMGAINIVKVTDELIKSLGVNTSMGLFRREDFCIVPINGKLRQLYSSTFPSYRLLSVEDLKLDKLIVALIGDEFILDYIDLMFEMGNNYPEYIVGYATPSIIGYFQKFISPNQTNGTRIAVFNIQKNIYYKVDDFFDDLYEKPFSLEEWTKAGLKMLKMIKSGEIKESYLSEPEPEISHSNLQKVVGSTYEKFINEENVDLVMLYKRENCPHCQKFIKVYSDFAKECEQEGIQGLKFGFIDVMKNSAKTPFPYMKGVPHVRIFPAKNKTDCQQVRGGNNRDSLIRLINKYGKQTLPFEVPPLDQGAVAMELFEMMIDPDKKKPQEEAIKDYMYLEEMSKYIEESKKDTQKSTDEL